MAKLPHQFHRYFWDTDPKKLDIIDKKDYVIKRILEMGDIAALKWLNQTYSRSQLTSTLTTSKQISQKSAQFFSLIYGVDPNRILCLKPEFLTKHRAIWQR